MGLQSWSLQLTVAQNAQQPHLRPHVFSSSAIICTVIHPITASLAGKLLFLFKNMQRQSAWPAVLACNAAADRPGSHSCAFSQDDLSYLIREKVFPQHLAGQEIDQWYSFMLVRIGEKMLMMRISQQEHDATTCQPKSLSGHVNVHCEACLPAMSSAYMLLAGRLSHADALHTLSLSCVAA